MLESNVATVLGMIGPSDLVLDIGGWAHPFNRANYVADVMPYETRGVFNSSGTSEEHFSKDTWIRHDMSGMARLPFKDKEVDYVICSHVLEDIRDPLRACAEIVRVGKRGYIEVPSRTVESIMGLEGSRYAGYCHHRWLIEIAGEELVFRFKNHLIHESRRYHLPKSHLAALSRAEYVSFLFWEGGFRYREAVQLSRSQLVRELEEYVRRQGAAPSMLWKALDGFREVARNPKLAVKQQIQRLPALKKCLERILGHKITIPRDKSIWHNLDEINLG